MDFIKYSLVILAIAVVSSFAVVSARDVYSVPRVGVTYVLHQNKAQSTGYHSKDTVSVQRYYNKETFSDTKNPCPKCEIETILYSSGGNIVSKFVTRTGQTKSFGSFSAQSDSYKLSLKRKDIYFLDTHHFAYWYVNE